MLDADTLGVFIPISAIIFGIGSGIVKSVLKSQEKRLEMRLNAQQGKNEDVTRQLQALRKEIADLRDTSTQFDLSLENAVQRLAERVNRGDTKAVMPKPQSVEEATQRIGLQ